MTTKQKFKEAITLINWWIIAVMFIIMNVALIFDQNLSKLKYNFIFIFLIICMILDRYMNIDFREYKKNNSKYNNSKHNCSCNNCKCNNKNDTKIDESIN